MARPIAWLKVNLTVDFEYAIDISDSPDLVSSLR